MERKIMKYAQNAWSEIRKAEKLFKELNDKESTYAWRFDELREAERLFNRLSMDLDRLETFFSEGDELLPQEELERLEREQLEDLVAEAMLEGEG